LPEPHLLELTDTRSDIARQALALYESAFPPAERVPVEGIIDSIRQRGSASGTDGCIPHFFTVVQDSRALGLAFYGYFRHTRLGFLYYLAVQPDLRGRGLGAWLLRKALEMLPQDAAATGGEPPRGLVWEVERPVDASTPADRDMRQRRINFYERSGALLMKGLDFLAPPLGENLPAVMYHVMFLPAPGFAEDLSARPFLTDILDTILLNGYGVDKEDEYYRNALKRLMGEE
jgi:GNAT superfamily N-acetyltransferase